MSAIQIPPIVKEVSVPVAPEAAFAAFTTNVARWWPLESHSVGGTDGLGLVLDEGGFVETLADGTACWWGSVLAWEPPDRLAMTWHPGQDPEPHTVVEVTFTAASDGTLVRLVHTGWENVPLPASGDRSELVGNYTEGWDLVLGAYVVSEAAVGAA